MGPGSGPGGICLLNAHRLHGHLGQALTSWFMAEFKKNAPKISSWNGAACMAQSGSPVTQPKVTRAACALRDGAMEQTRL